MTVATLGIVWQSDRAVVTRSLDGVAPSITDELRHAAAHLEGVAGVFDAKARWIGHRLHAEVTIALGDDLSLAQANGIATELKRELLDHWPALRTANIVFASDDMVATPARAPRAHVHDAAP